VEVGEGRGRGEGRGEGKGMGMGGEGMGENGRRERWGNLFLCRSQQKHNQTVV